MNCCDSFKGFDRVWAQTRGRRVKEGWIKEHGVELKRLVSTSGDDLYTTGLFLDDIIRRWFECIYLFIESIECSRVKFNPVKSCSVFDTPSDSVYSFQFAKDKVLYAHPFVYSRIQSTRFLNNDFSLF